MTGESEMVEAIHKAFGIALLLTGNIEAAEASVLDGITALESEKISGDSLLLAAAESAIQRRAEFLEQSEGLSNLPLESRRLSLFASYYRRCFLLPVHLSMHDVKDAFQTALQGLLHIESCDVDRREGVRPVQDVKVDSRASPPPDERQRLVRVASKYNYWLRGPKENGETAKQRSENLPRSSPSLPGSITRSSDRRPVVSKAEGVRPGS